MARKTGKKESPTIVAITHFSFNRGLTPQDSLKQLENIFEKAALKGKERTVFIEGSQLVVDQYLSGKRDPSCGFFKAIWLAKQHGWNIVPLDKESLSGRGQEAFPSKTARYINYNLRERSWAQKLKRLKPREQDFIVLHPNHVEGFLLETGMKENKVVWIEKPEYRLPQNSTYLRRLSFKQVRQLKARRKRGSKRRA